MSPQRQSPYAAMRRSYGAICAAALHRCHSQRKMRHQEQECFNHGRNILKRIGSLLAAATAALVLSGVAARAQDAALIEAAKKEGKLTYYTTRLAASMVAVAKAFETKYGIKVEASRHTNEDLIAKIINESKAGRATAD